MTSLAIGIFTLRYIMISSKPNDKIAHIPVPLEDAYSSGTGVDIINSSLLNTISDSDAQQTSPVTTC